jgi:amino acid transporter
MTTIKNIGIFVKINTVGVVFILMIIVFIIVVGIIGLTNTHYVFELPAHVEPGETVHELKLFSSSFGPLLGILGGGYYLHNITLPIIRNAKNPENNVRDVFWGYFLVFVSYSVCGLMGYIGFSGSYFTDTLHQPQILSNCLLMFPSGDVVATIIRFCTFCQILAAMCLMFACQRGQIFLLIYGDAEKAEKQPLKYTVLANVLILIAPFLLAVFYP